MSRKTTLAIIFTLGLTCAGTLLAQPVNLPRASPHAVVTQTVGLTEIAVDYHRPRVNERTIWGALVPYDQPWRAGANENTTVSFSDDVEIGGETLAAGTYGFHVIPKAEGPWTVAFSENHTSWGSFSYNPEEDALRVEVAPIEGPHQEALAFEFVDPQNDSVTLALAWEKVRLPVEIAVDTEAVVLADIRNQLRSIPGFTWQGNQSAANWALQNDVALEDAMGWIDTSIQIEERFENLNVKAQLLAKAGETEASEEMMARALEKASPLQIHGYGRQLIAQGKADEALEIFKLNAERNPETWFIDVGLARGYSALGELEKAAEHMWAASKKAPEAQQAAYEGMAKQLEGGESI